jgi:hypothetical protein
MVPPIYGKVERFFWEAMSSDNWLSNRSRMKMRGERPPHSKFRIALKLESPWMRTYFRSRNGSR